MPAATSGYRAEATRLHLPEFHPVCIDYGALHPFAVFPGRMFVSYETFISNDDMADPQSGEPVAHFGQALRNDRAASLHGGSPRTDERDGFDDYFRRDNQLEVFDRIVLIASCGSAFEGKPIEHDLIERLLAGEKMVLAIKLFHLDDGRTGVNVHATQ